MQSCSSNLTKFQMQGQSPDIEFSLSELEQAGLLDIAQLHSSEVSSIPRPLAQGDRRSHNNEVSQLQLVVSQTELQCQAASSKALSSPQVQPQQDTNVKSHALEREHTSEESTRRKCLAHVVPEPKMSVSRQTIESTKGVFDFGRRYTSARNRQLLDLSSQKLTACAQNCSCPQRFIFNM